MAVIDVTRRADVIGFIKGIELDSQAGAEAAIAQIGVASAQRGAPDRLGHEGNAFGSANPARITEAETERSAERATRGQRCRQESTARLVDHRRSQSEHRPIRGITGTGVSVE